MEYKIVGLRREKYIGIEISGSNCDFEYTDSEFERDVILMVDTEGQKVELTLYVEEGECGSGWCSASFAKYVWTEVDNFAEKTHATINPVVIDINEGDLETDEDDLTTEVFYISELGGCRYYPSGYYTVDMGKFKEVGVLQTNRPVHIFYGDSNLCKSHLAALTGKSVFETDAMPTSKLPSIITEDIVVIGNRYDVLMDDVKLALYGECKVVLVEFKEEINK